MNGTNSAPVVATCDLCCSLSGLLTTAVPVLLCPLTASPPPFLQGTLLFCLLLLAIWAPLLLFSSGAPTYQTPGIVEVRANASFGVTTSYGHYQGASVPASYLY
jgi:hypothetical protein